MVKKKEYEPNPKATKSMFLKAGFTDTSGYYSIRKDMYKNMIHLRLLVDKDLECIAVHMLDSEHCEYISFWDEDFGRNNLVADEVKRNYNNFMDELVKRGLIKEVVSQVMI